MPYYAAGDYYQGDNYAAGGFLGSIGKAIGGAVKGFVTGGPLGAISGAIGGITKAPASQQSMALTYPVVPTPGIKGFAQRLVPGGATGYQVDVLGRRRRRMDVLNLKALRRAIRRAKGFERQARRVGSFFQPGKSYRLKGRAKRAR